MNIPISPPLSALPPAVPTEPIYRLSVEQYHQMIQAGILTEDDPVELLEGWLVIKMPINPPHTLATEQLRDLLPPLLPPGWFVNSQAPVTTDTSEPEPDALVVRGHRRQYTDRNPGPEDAAIVIEVADSSLRRDRGWKKRLYARVRVPVYWIVNLVDRQVEIYTEPSGPSEQPDYAQRQDYGPADQVPVVIEGREVGRLSVTDLLP
ncbi:MAG: Uma2 family endonuclease [Gemmataceae bacterium]|nr:Uma2 family endonuclease [Gemmataceae bacterium]